MRTISLISRCCSILATSCLALVLWLPTSSSFAAIISVTTNIDTVPVPPSSDCRLRAAIAAANANIQVEGCTAGSPTGEDFITLSGIAGQVITLDGTALPDITSNIAIFGFGAEVSANDQSGIFNVAFDMKTFHDFSVDNLVIRNANSAAAILHQSMGDLTITNSTITDNAQNGVVYVASFLNFFQSVFISDSEFSSNGGRGLEVSITNGSSFGVFDSSFLNNGSGGLVFEVDLEDDMVINMQGCVASGNEIGIIADGVFNMINCTISDNTDKGIDGENIDASTISLSTISGNGGGGISIDSVTSAPLEINNSTISGNSAYGIRLNDDSDVELTQVTIADNSGVGVNANCAGCAVGLNNSLITNTAGGTDCSGPGSLVVEGVSIMEDSGDCSVSGSGTLLYLSDLQLGPLQDNGGATLSHLPLSGSPVIDAGDNTVSIGSFDQRDDPFDRMANGGTVDIGAIEVQDIAQAGPNFLVNTLTDSRDGSCDGSPNDCSLYEAIEAANSNPDSSIINFATNLVVSPGAITLSGSPLPTVTTPVVINGGGITVDGNENSGIFLVNGASLELNRILLTGGDATEGGAIHATNALVTLQDQGWIFDNSTMSSGGGIWASNSTISILNSLLAFNNSQGEGGAVYADAGSIVLVQNSTVSGNGFNADGTLYMAGGSTLNLVHATVANNFSDVAAVVLDSSTLNTSNSIMAGTIGSQDCAQTGGSTINAFGGNIVETDSDVSPCNVPGALAVDPKLGLITNNGGNTLTHLPGPSSPAVNAGDNAEIPAGLMFDQRGAGFPRILEGTVDIGAVESLFVLVKDGFEDPQ